jgi:hypothetical protein
MDLTETRMRVVVCFLFKRRSEIWNLQAYKQSKMLYNILSLSLSLVLRCLQKKIHIGKFNSITCEKARSYALT